MKKEGKKYLTANVTQLEVVLLGVYLLGGDSKSVDTEDVAVKCHELAPGMFSWQKYKDQINLELVRVNLSNAKKNENGELLYGSGREGWRLNQNGIDWFDAHGKNLLDKGPITWNSVRSSAGSIDSVRKRREKKRILASPAWESWSNGKEISEQESKKIFRIDEYATGKMAEIKVVRIRSLFDDDEELGPFIREVANIALTKTSGRQADE